MKNERIGALVAFDLFGRRYEGVVVGTFSPETLRVRVGGADGPVLLIGKGTTSAVACPGGCGQSEAECECSANIDEAMEAMRA